MKCYADQDADDVPWAAYESQGSGVGATPKSETRKVQLKRWSGTESNRRHGDFQSPSIGQKNPRKTRFPTMAQRQAQQLGRKKTPSTPTWRPSSTHGQNYPRRSSRASWRWSGRMANADGPFRFAQVLSRTSAVHVIQTTTTCVTYRDDELQEPTVPTRPTRPPLVQARWQPLPSCPS